VRGIEAMLACLDAFKNAHFLDRIPYGISVRNGQGLVIDD